MKPLFTMMQLLPLFLLAVYSQAQGPAPALGSPAPATWNMADYARFTPSTFSQHPPAKKVMDRDAMDQALLNAALFYATNAERLKHGLPPFRPSPALIRCAFEHSRDMAVLDFFNHENPKDWKKRTAWKRLAAQGVTGGVRAENIAMRTAKGVTYLEAAEAIVKPHCLRKFL